jgi:hypothetical protein
MHYRLILTFLLASLFCQAAAAEELTNAKRSDIKRLMEMTGSVNVAKQFAAAISQQMFRTLKAARPDIPDRALTIIDRELLALFSERLAAPGGLVDQVIPVYDKYFTHAEIQELIAFYQTPVGRKAILVLPKVVNDSMLAGQRWGQSLNPEIQKRVMEALKRDGVMI